MRGVFAQAFVDGVNAQASRPGPYVAKSASAKTDDWPLWFVAGQDGVNCLSFPVKPGAIFTSREMAKAAAAAFNSRSEAMDESKIDARVAELLETNNALLERAQKAEQERDDALIALATGLRAAVKALEPYAKDGPAEVLKSAAFDERWK